jgi:hypothetical protein
LQGDEMRALRELKRSADSPFVFTSERGAPFTTAGFAKMVTRAGEAASSEAFIRTCFGTPAATPWRTEGTTPAHYKPTLATKTFSTLFDTRN